MIRGARVGLLAVATASAAFGCQLIAGIDELPPAADTADMSADARADTGLASQTDANAKADADAARPLEAGPIADAKVEQDAGADADASADAAASADADADASADADATADADVDTDADADAGTTAFCATLTPAPTFCADFEQPPVNSGWTSTTGDVGAMSIESGAFVVSYPAAGAGVDGTTYLAEQLSSAPLTAHLSFDFRITTDDAMKAKTQYAVLQVGDSPNAYALAFQSTNGAFELVEQSPQPDSAPPSLTTHPLASAPPAGKRTRVQLDVSYGPTPSVTVSYDGAPVLANQSITPSLTGTGFHLLLGAVYVQGPTAGGSVLYDNVVLDVQ